MIDLRTEKDIEALRQAALLMEKALKRQMHRMAELRARLAKAQGDERPQLELELRFLKEQIRETQQRLYGTSSEKRPVSDAPTQEQDKAPRRGHGPTLQPELPLAEETHELDEADRECPVCGGALVELEGQFEESDEVDVVELSFKLVRHKRKKYRCRCGGCLETAPGPLKVVPGGRYSARFATHVAVGKYADHLPLARQVKQMSRSGLEVTSQALWDQLDAQARHLEPTYEALWRFVLTFPVVGVDETTWRLMHKGGTKKWWVWSVTCPEGVFYRVSPSRSHSAADQLLNGYRGTVVADGYSAYETLQRKRTRPRDGPPFALAYCWAHVRRKFFECHKDYPVAEEMLDLIGELYKVESEIRSSAGSGDLEALGSARDQRSRKIVADIKAWMVAQDALPRSSLGRAISYATGLWPGLVRFLDDPRIPVDNNATERALRGPVVGRKNHYGSRSRRGTEAAAVFYSLIETAKLVGLEPADYLLVATRRAILAPGTVTLPRHLADEALKESLPVADYLRDLDPKNPFARKI